MDYTNNFKTAARNYIQKVGGISKDQTHSITQALEDCLQTNEINRLPAPDFQLMVNQFLNLVCFGPITNMELFITEACNMDCGYCFVREKKRRRMPFETIFTAINMLSFYSGNKNKLNLTLFGGEPLLEKPTIFRVVDHVRELEARLKSKKIDISITTNGTLLDEELLRYTSDKVKYLLSIDGNKKTHDKYRKYRDGRGTYADIASRISLLKKYQPWLGARMTILPETVASLYDNIRHLWKLGVNQYILGPAMEIEWPDEALKAYEDQLQKTAHFYLLQKNANQPIRIPLFEANEKKNGAKNGQWNCGAGINTISVSTNGDIYPCSKFVGYEGFDAPQLILGNIHEGITNIGLRRKMALAGRPASSGCVNCSLKESCGSGCPADNYYLHRNLRTPGKTSCEIRKIEDKVIGQIYSGTIKESGLMT